MRSLCSCSLLGPTNHRLLLGCSGDFLSGPIMEGHEAWYRGYEGFLSGLSKSAMHPSAMDP